ncbi:MAG TPA: ABC transporter ATP-binding protein [Acidimicrobiales bacterium]|nr:ABC transporter ATP-binding protein [Acidimicrobiales bacterium]
MTDIQGGAAPGAVLEVVGLRTEFHLRHSTVHAVDGVSFSVAAGECVGLVGESGCGKSTTGLSVMKLLPNVGHVTAGQMRLLGRDLVALSEREMQQVRGNDVAMIFQDPMTSLNPTWTIGRQIAEGVRLHRDVSKREAQDRALEVLELVGMPRPAERIGYYPHQLSGGLRQRVMIAMALACEPTLLIADEPTTALDVTIQAQILDLIDELRERLRMAVVLITHDMGVIAARTSRVMVMYAGKIVEAASTDELFTSMRHPYAEALLNSIPRLDQDRSKPLFSIPGLPPDLSSTVKACRFAPRCRYASERCRTEEPLLAPDASGERAGVGEGAGDAWALAHPGTAEHVYACFHPVSGPQAEPKTGAAAATPDDVGLALPAEVAKPAARLDELTTRAVVLRVENLVKEYPVTSGAIMQRRLGSVKAVSDVSFEVHEGETFGLVGESGCGKTTIGRLAVALERPSGGSVSFEDTDLASLKGADLRRRRRDLQLMFQDPYASLDPRMRVGTIVREPLVVQGIGSGDGQRSRVAELLVEVGLSPKAAELYPHEFSGGQRQRIGLARALALNPKLIVADEPVSALDVSIQAQILNLMRTLQERHGLTYVVISHDLAVVKYLADVIGVMYLGKLVEQGPAEELYARAAHPYTRGLIDTIPAPDPVTARARKHAAVRGELPSAINPPSGCRFRTRCPFAQERCAEEEPALRVFGPGHVAACHFPLQTPVPEESAGMAAAQR